MIQQVNRLEARDAWQAQARETFRDDIDRQQLALTTGVLTLEESSGSAEDKVARWLEQHAELHDRWCRLISEVRSGNEPGFALFTVAVRALVGLAESSSE